MGRAPPRRARPEVREGEDGQAVPPEATPGIGDAALGHRDPRDTSFENGGLTASGTPDEVVQRVERYREAGVTLPILRPAARHQTPRVIDLFAPR